MQRGGLYFDELEQILALQAAQHHQSVEHISQGAKRSAWKSSGVYIKRRT